MRKPCDNHTCLQLQASRMRDYSALHSRYQGIPDATSAAGEVSALTPVRNGFCLLFTAMLMLLVWPIHYGHAEKPEMNRMIVLSDIEADPDDTQTLIRLLLYSNQIEIQGLVATTSVHQKTRIVPESIRKVIEAYGKVLPNLQKHDAGFPDVASLMQLVKEGSPVYGMQGVGEGKHSEGSEWILRTLEQDDARPLWISVWGGSNTFAQALFDLRLRKSEDDCRALVSRLRVYTISDQDDSGIWIRTNFPDLFYIVSPGGYGNATWTGINNVINGMDNSTISNAWLREHIQQGHGPLGALYPDVAYGMEGDTPSWLGLVPNGLNVPERPDWGGWGGRYECYIPEHESLDLNGFNGGIPIEPEPRPIWTNALDSYSPYVPNPYGRSVRLESTRYEDHRVTLWRWRDDFQNDFAARMDWCWMDYDEANHPPVPALGHPETVSVSSGSYFMLDASGTRDPDGDHLQYLWFNYPEAGSYGSPIPIASAENMYQVHVKMPEVEKEETAHFVLKVTDGGSPSLTRYKRVIVTIQP